MRLHAYTLVGLFSMLLASGPTAALAADSRIDGVVHREVSKCWTPAFGPYVVTVRFELKRDGSLSGPPAVIDTQMFGAPDAAQQKAMRAALQAVRDCTPIALPPASYEYWRNVVIKFEAKAPVSPFGASASPQ